MGRGQVPAEASAGSRFATRGCCSPSILESAVEYGYLQANPARGVKFPQKALKKKPAMIAGDDFAKLLKQLSEPHRTMVSLIAATGLRIGELLALRWGALDLEVGTLAVRESVLRGQVPGTENAAGTADDSAGSACRQGAEGASGPRVARKGDGRSGVRQSQGRSVAGIKAADERAATGGGGGGARTCDVASVPPRPFVAAQRPQRPGEDRAGAARTREHQHDAQHLHARCRCVAPEAIEAVEERLFVNLDANGLKSADGLESAAPASDSVN